MIESGHVTVYGVGIRDIPVKSTPHYQLWCNLLSRCYRNDDKCPSYKGVTIAEDWKILSRFSEWVDSQNYIGLELDKDILGDGTFYSPDTCRFVPVYVNNLVLTNRGSRGTYPLGVTRNTSGIKNKFRARLGRYAQEAKHLGRFPCPWTAHRAWQEAKSMHIMDVADIYKLDTCFDSAVYDGLVRISQRIKYELENNLETFTLKGVIK